MYEANFEFNTNTIEFDSEINTKDIQANLILNVIPDRTSQLINDSDYATNSAIGNGTITFTQGGVTKGTITTNQSENSTIELDITIVDSALSTTSENPVQNKVITTELNKKIETIKVNGTAQTTTNKTVNISVPSAVTETTVANWGFTKNQGTVTSVNNILPVNGNVTITMPASATWGNITGTLSNQTDLQNALNNKAATTAIPTKTSDLNNDSGYITKSVNNLTYYTPTSSLATVATSGSYIDLTNKPTIGTANLTVKRNGTSIGTFNANATSAVSINVSVPTTATEVDALPSTTTINDLTSTAQQAALNSGINSTKVSIIASNTSAINSINSLIPSATTASNPLTNEDFVNSSIATNTAYFIGTFNSVAELEAYSGTLTNNDYAFVVTTDSVGNTAYDRYKYNADTQEWLFEYELNNSSFTAEQWAAINSGANEQNISAIASNTSAITGLQNNKQDNLTAGANVQINENTISATDTTYTNGTGLNLSNTTFSVDFTEVAAASDLPNYVQKSSIVGTITSTSTDATIPSAKCVYDELSAKANNSDVIKKTGSGQQTITATNNTPLGLKTTDSSNVCYMSFNNNNGYRASLGVNNNRQLVFWNNSTLYNVAMTANIPAIEKTLSASSTDAKTVGAKCAYDALNLKQTKANLVTTISASSTDATYPSAKCVYDSLSGKQDISNLVTSVSASSTDAQYPSAKLFYDTCGDIEALINAL